MMFYGEDRFACQEKGIYANLLMPLRVKRFLLQTLFAFCPKAVPFQRLGKVTNYFPFIVILHHRIVANHAPRHCFLRIHRAIQSEIRIFAVSLGAYGAFNRDDLRFAEVRHAALLLAV